MTRKFGNTTNKICWNLTIIIDEKTILNRDYKTLQDIATELGYSYNVVSEMAINRKKRNKGKYDTQYHFTKL